MDIWVWNDVAVGCVWARLVVGGGFRFEVFSRVWVVTCIIYLTIRFN